MKLDNVKPLEIDRHLGKVKNKVALVGVELEGAWTKLPTGVTQLEHDGSVFNARLPVGASHVGELPTQATTPAGIGELIRAYHPQKIDSTCGMHMHMSFDSLWHYTLLMVPEYPATVIEYLKRWAKEKGFKPEHHIWARLRGESRYCRNEFYPDLQARSKRKTHDMDIPGQRYTSVHYCGRLKTIECRVLPMMKSTNLAISGVQEVIKITNACLYVLGKQKPRSKELVSVTLPDGVVYEESIVEVL